MALTREQLERAGYPKELLDVGSSVKGFAGRRLGDIGSALSVDTGELGRTFEESKTGQFLGGLSSDFQEGLKGAQELFSTKQTQASTGTPTTPTPLLRTGQTSTGGDLDIQEVERGLGITEPIESAVGVTEPTVPELKTPTTGVMDAIRQLSTTAQGLQTDLDKLRDLPTDTSTVEKKESVDDQMAQIQLDITNKILSAMETPIDGGVMDRFAARQEQIQDASDAAKQLIESRSGVAIEEEREAGGRRLESEREARRGFATNRAFFEQIEETTEKRVRDLETKRDDALASQDFTLAESLSGLIGQEQEAITTARQQNLENLMDLSSELRSLRGFETPTEAREASFQNALALMGATKSIDFDVKQAENLQNIQAQYAHIPEMATATSVEQAIGMIGPELQKDVTLSRQLDQAKLNQINASIMASLSSAGGSQLPATQVTNLSDGKFLPGLLDDLEGLMDENKGLFGRTTGRVPFSESRDVVNAQLRTVSQLVGKFMEGGVLRKEDEEKYAKMLPKMTDQYDVATSKLRSIRTMLQMKYNSYLTDFSGSGFDVSGFSPLEIPDTTSNITEEINLFD